MTTLSMIVPTLGRPTLTRTIHQAIDAMGPNDELIIVSDGPSVAAREQVAKIDDPRIRYMETIPTRKWGCHQYDIGSMFALSNFLMFSTDDDIIPSTAFEDVRKGVDGKPWPHVFSLHHLPIGRVLRNSIAQCEVGAQQIVVPNIPSKLAKWSDNVSDTNDHAYLMATLAIWKRLPEFHDEIISVMPQHNFGK